MTLLLKLSTKYSPEMPGSHCNQGNAKFYCPIKESMQFICKGKYYLIADSWEKCIPYEKHVV